MLLLMADYGKPGEPEALIPYVTQETLAEMIGTTRSRVSVALHLNPGFLHADRFYST